MKNEAIVVDQDLSLRSLADKVELHPNKLSWLLNRHLGKNFNDAFKKSTGLTPKAWVKAIVKV